MGDRFESEYMADDDSVVYRDKRISRGMAAILGIWGPFCWGLAALVGLGNATASKPVPESSLPFVVAGIVAFGFMFILMALAFAVLRTVVSRDELIVKYGLWGPTLSLRNIRSCTVDDYDWTQFGGWGIRRSLKGDWAYVPGPGQVVNIEYEDDGQLKRIQIGAENPTKLAKQINRAREELTRQRIGVDDEAAIEAEAEAEAEALAELAAKDEAIRTER